MNLSSIHALTPLEQGGPIARTGFLYQDHVAARFCLEMLLDGEIAEVWCETEDDITLLWGTSESPLVEFVQVKGNELSQLWSAALICSGGDVDSIVVKSLQHDRCLEPCVFRILTRTPLNPELAVLKLDRGHQDRSLSNPKMVSIHKAVCKALKDKVSECGRSGSHWVAETLWDVAESETALKNANLQMLATYLETQDEALFTDQCAELYDRLLRRVQDASFPKWVGAGQEKKIKRQGLQIWVKDNVKVVRGHAPTKGGENLHKKMTLAKLPASTVENADHLRLSYRRKTLTTAYQRDDNLKSAELEVTAVLQELVSNLDAGKLKDDGIEFHSVCLASLHAVRENYPTVDLSFLQGVLYAITDRCRHRFRRASV